MMLKPAVPGLRFVREPFRFTPLCRSSVTRQQTSWDLPMRIIVLGACRIECTFSLHHMDRVLVIPTFTTNRKVHLRVTRKAFPISVSSSTLPSSGLGWWKWRYVHRYSCYVRQSRYIPLYHHNNSTRMSTHILVYTHTSIYMQIDTQYV